ncbi:MAG: hypothetical protein ABR880_17105 [Candidatus Sulfotelmatobacter sp.]|jgi:hypothetical protein
MASPKKKPKSHKTKRNPKPLPDPEVLRKLFPKEVVEYVETQLKDADEGEK